MITCIADLLDLTELRRVRQAVQDMAFVDGGATAGHRAKLVKNNLQMDKRAPGATEIKKLVMYALRRHPEFQKAAFPKSIRPPLVSRYTPGMAYGLHVDDALMGPGGAERSDLAVTIFLSDPADYDGGELIVQGPMGEQQIKLPAGAGVVYPSSSLHQVAPIERGERLAAVTWVQSKIRDPAKREVLYDLDRVRTALHKLQPENEAADLAFKSYSNLLRMWSEN